MLLFPFFPRDCLGPLELISQGVLGDPLGMCSEAFMVPPPSFCRLYHLYNHWIMRTATYFFIFLNLSLAVFEEPAVYPLPFLVSVQWRSSNATGVALFGGARAGFALGA